MAVNGFVNGSQLIFKGLVYQHTRLKEISEYTH